MSAEREKALAAKGRHIALVIAATMLGWLAVTLFIGPALGLTGRYALLFDFAALAGFRPKKHPTGVRSLWLCLCV